METIGEQVLRFIILVFLKKNVILGSTCTMYFSKTNKVQLAATLFTFETEKLHILHLKDK